MELGVCLNHGSVSIFAGKACSSVKYLALWKTWRSNVDGMKIEKKSVAAHCKGAGVFLSVYGIGNELCL